MTVAERADTRQLLERLLGQRILVLDGAMGTMVHALEFTERDFRGQQFAEIGIFRFKSVCSEAFNVTRHDPPTCGPRRAQ